MRSKAAPMFNIQSGIEVEGGISNETKKVKILLAEPSFTFKKVHKLDG